MKSRNPLLLLLPLICSCGLLFEKHESPWFFEWRIYDRNTNAVVGNSDLGFRFEIKNNADYFTSLFEDTIEDNGYVFINAYSDYQQDFLARNPYIMFKIFKDTTVYMDTVLYWKDLAFGSQKLDTIQHDSRNSYMTYDTANALNNVNKLKLYISYK